MTATHTTTPPLPPLPDELTAKNWHDGMTREEWDTAAHEIVGWLCGTDPDLFRRAVEYARAGVQEDRARAAQRRAANPVIAAADAAVDAWDAVAR